MLNSLNESDARSFAEAAIEDLACAESSETADRFRACITDALANAQLLLDSLRKLHVDC